MRFLLTFLVCLAVCGCNNTTCQERHTPVHYQASTPRDTPMGLLGHPLGTALTIEGVRKEHGKLASQFLVVDTVNSQKLATPIDIWIQNLKHPWLPKATRCILKGYETGSMVGTPPALLDNNLESQINWRSQIGWQFLRRFVITSVVEPKSLEIE